MDPSAPTLSDSHLADVGGLSVHRALPQHGRRTVGAWCFLDRFGPVEVSPERTMTVGPHPHVGLHTVTWLLAGQVLHSDSLGNRQLIRPGQVNLMTAGRGIAHAEDARGQLDGTMDGVQLWVAQPERTRHDPPSFAHYAELPVLPLGSGTATVLVGMFGEALAPTHIDSPLVGVDIAGRGQLDLPLDPTFEYGFHVLHGGVHLADLTAVANQFVYVGLGHDAVQLDLGPGSRILLLGGVPFSEEITMWWNFVGRERDELELAYAEWRDHSSRFGPVDSTLDRIDAPRPFWVR
jgi:redox-sensitive bicupin YhaK (pirin superfamily)